MIHTDLNVVYPEVSALSVLMGYQTSNAGCCKVGEAAQAGSGVGGLRRRAGPGPRVQVH